MQILMLRAKFLSILIYADESILISDSEPKLQSMLDSLFSWCGDILMMW